MRSDLIGKLSLSDISPFLSRNEAENASRFFPYSQQQLRCRTEQPQSAKPPNEAALKRVEEEKLLSSNQAQIID